MRSPQTLTSRLVPAIAVTLVSTLVLGAVLVTADAATTDAAVLPASFGVAAPRQGDAWAYDATLSGEWTFGDDDDVRLDASFPFLDLQWAGSGAVRGGDGLLHDANLLHAKGVFYQPEYLQDVVDDVNASASDAPIIKYWDPATTADWVLAGGKSVVAAGGRMSLNDSSISYGPGNLGFGLGAEYRTTYIEQGSILYPVDKVPCLAVNPLQGADLNLSEAIVLFDACILGGSNAAKIPADLAFRARAIENISGVQSVRFDAEADGLAVQAWFTPAVPYPVRLVIDLPTARTQQTEQLRFDAPGERTLVLQMRGYRAGESDLDLVDDPVDRQAAPALVHAAPLSLDGRRVGLDETGVQHDFPLSVAFASARDDAQFADLRLTLAAHPDAYVAAAYFTQGYPAGYSPLTQQLPSSTQSWVIALSWGGKGVYSFAAMRDTFDNIAVPGLVGQLPAPLKDAVDQLPAYIDSFSSYVHAPGLTHPLPYPSALPAEVPTARSVQERWAGFDGSGTPAEMWGFTYSCGLEAKSDDDCKPTLHVEAGVRRNGEFNQLQTSGTALPGDPFGTEVDVRIQRSVRMSADGIADRLLVDDHRSYRSSASYTPGPSAAGHAIPIPPSDPGTSVQSVEVSGIPSATIASWFPEPQQAAGIGFLGLAIGALYWVWPKLGLMGLFSRLERGQLLDHPARARLVQLVESQPGIHFHDLAQKSGLANGTAVHHLRKLSEGGHLTVRRSGRYTCYFPGGRVDPHAAAAAPLLKSDGARQVLETVRASPGLSNLEVAQATGLQPSTVNYHVQRLSQAGLVAALRDGRVVRLHPGARAGTAGLAGAAA